MHLRLAESLKGVGMTPEEIEAMERKLKEETLAGQLDQLGEAGREFFMAMCEAMGIPKLVKWLSGLLGSKKK